MKDREISWKKICLMFVEFFGFVWFPQHVFPLWKKIWCFFIDGHSSILVLLQQLRLQAGLLGIMAARRLVGKTPDPARHKSPNPQRLKEAEKEMKKRTKKPAGSDVESSSSKGSSSGLLRGERPGVTTPRSDLLLLRMLQLLPLRLNMRLSRCLRRKMPKRRNLWAKRKLIASYPTSKIHPQLLTKIVNGNIIFCPVNHTRSHFQSRPGIDSCWICLRKWWCRRLPGPVGNGACACSFLSLVH